MPDYWGIKMGGGWKYWKKLITGGLGIIGEGGRKTALKSKIVLL